MRGLMMDYQLTIPAIVRRAEIALRTQDGRHAGGRIGPSSATPTRDVIDRAKRLAVALADSACSRATGWRRSPGPSHQHLEAYLAIPSIGAVLHTLNLRLHHDDLAYIVNDADDAC